MVVIHRLTDGADVVAQCAVALASVSGDDGGGLRADETPVLRLQHLLPYGGGTHLYRPADGVVTGVGLEGIPVLDVY